MAGPWTRTIRRGMTVFDRDNEKIGSVIMPRRSAGYVEASSGFLGLGGHVFIPLGAIRDVRAEGLYLQVAQNDIQRLGWNVPPPSPDQPDAEPPGATPAGTRHREERPHAFGTGSWEEMLPRYRARWKQRTSSGDRWEEHEPHYRYGWEQRNNSRYRGRSWPEVEVTLRRDWETSLRGTSWDEAAGSIRDAWDDPTAPYAGAADERILELREEALQARTEPVQTGEIAIRKEIITEHQTVEVPVRREEVIIERRTVEPRPASSGISEAAEIRVPVWEEQVYVETQPVVTEEIRVGKRAVEEQRRVSGRVRREVAHIEREGDVTVQGEQLG